MARYEKVAEALKRQISDIIQNELKDPRLGFVTITGVELTQDLRYAKIFFSVLGKKQDYHQTKMALASAKGFIRHLIAQRIQLRFAPEIVFKEDRSSEYSIKIQEVLDEISELNESNASSKVRIGTKIRKVGRHEPRKDSRLHKKK